MSFKKIIINVLLLSIVSVAIFTLISLFFNQNNSPADGDDLWGWPLVYYTYLGGKMEIEPDTRTYFNQTYLILDWMISIFIAGGLVYSIKKLVKLIKK